MTDNAVRIVIIGALIAAAVITAFVVLAAVTWDLPRADESTIATVGAWSSYVVAVATVMLVIGAAVAAIRIGDQMRQADAHHRDGFRPILDFTDASLRVVATDASVGAPQRSGLVDVELRNIGVGPARNVRVHLWVVPREGSPVGPDPRLFLDTHGLDRDSPHYVGGRNSLAREASGQVVVERTIALPPSAVIGPDGIHVIAKFTFGDVFDRTFETWEVRGVQRG